jgi:hypothetical protein
MGQVMAGRIVAGVGVVAGIVAIWLDIVSLGASSEKYSDDGTTIVYLLVTLLLAAACLASGAAGGPALDAGAAVFGGAALGYYLFFPAAAAWDQFDLLGAGAWLGLCTALIPIGAVLASVAGRAWRVPDRQPSPIEALPAIVGVVLVFVAIWLPATQGRSYWNLSAPGHAIGLMMIVLCAVVALRIFSTLTWATPLSADAGLALAAVTFGLYETGVVENAFNKFGSLGSGAWLGAAGAVVLLLGTASLWSAAMLGRNRLRPGTEPPAAAAPAPESAAVTEAAPPPPAAPETSPAAPETPTAAPEAPPAAPDAPPAP